MFHSYVRLKNKVHLTVTCIYSYKSLCAPGNRSRNRRHRNMPLLWRSHKVGCVCVFSCRTAVFQNSQGQIQDTSTVIMGNLNLGDCSKNIHCKSQGHLPHRQSCAGEPWLKWSSNLPLQTLKLHFPKKYSFQTWMQTSRIPALPPLLSYRPECRPFPPAPAKLQRKAHKLEENCRN